ncbi:MAG: RNA methyltransferase, partial [Candidatus Omnitrophica bacterium]|nr:RNA methyltransferase [Candidatus Omnitrophota bacterium]
EVENFIYTTFAELLENCLKKQIVIIFLDNLTDPQNLGSIIRTTACMGGFAIAIPKHDSCKITDTVLHVASGGENYTPLCVVGNTAKTLVEAKRSGCWIAGSILKGGTNIDAAELAFPLCLVMGSEGKGIREGLIKHLDFKITLPMKGAHLSFNVAVATALFSYEISRQREQRTRS